MRRRVKGHMDSITQDILNDLYRCGKRLHMGVYNLRHSDEPGAMLDIQTRKNLFTHLETGREFWNMCAIFLIEQQYFSTYNPKGKKSAGTSANVDAIKIAENLAAWLLLNYPDKEVIFFGAQYKTQILGAPDGLTKPQRKKWSIENAKRIFELRKDEEALEMMKKGKKGGQKQDDVSDALNQCQAWKYRCLIADF